MARHDDGAPKTYIFEVGPVAVVGSADDPRRTLQVEKGIQQDIEGLIRAYWQVGRRSELVRSRIVSAGCEA